jgi:hypothetical protein
VRQADKLGLLMGVVVNYTGYSLSVRPNDLGPGPLWPQVFFRFGLLLQVLQLIWCVFLPNSYSRARLRITVLQRARVLSGLVCGYLTIPARIIFYGMVGQIGETDVAASKRKAFIGILVTGPLMNLLSCLNHPLPFKYQAVYQMFNFLCYLAWGMRHQLEVVGIWGLTPWVRLTCEVMEGISWGPVLSRFSLMGLACGGGHATGLVMSYMHAVVGNLAALQVVYWQEYLSKTAWMKEQGLAADGVGRDRGSDGSSRRMPWLRIIAFTWGSCALSWLVLAPAHMIAWHAAAADATPASS